MTGNDIAKKQYRKVSVLYKGKSDFFKNLRNIIGFVQWKNLLRKYFHILKHLKFLSNTQT